MYRDDTDDTLAEGARRRDEGIQQATRRRKRQRLVLRGQIRLLRAMLRDRDREATTDATCLDLKNAYANGGKWRGHITLGLSRACVITKTGKYIPSARPARHACPIPVWRAVVRDEEILDEISRKRQELAEMPDDELQPSLIDRPGRVSYPHRFSNYRDTE